MLKLYYYPLSFPALGTLFTAEAAGLEYESHIVDLQKGEHKAPDFLSINPMGRVPAMVDGDFKLSESVAIMRYIARKSRSGLYPTELEAQAEVDQWTDFSIHHVRSAMGRVQFNRVVAKFFGAEPDEKSLEAGLNFLATNLPFIEERLSQQPFLCGNTMTIADTALLSALEPAEMCGFDLSPYPTIKAWRETRMSETFYTNVHSHFGAELGM